MERLNMESKDILNENIEKVAELFPNVLVESEDGKKIDFDILRQELSDDIVDGPRERYHLDFPGKREAIIEANRKTTKTLRPIKDKSVNFDTTKNIYIEGDNLEALKILQESYLGKIKCIYIDPPYNTGNDFVYNDEYAHKEKEEMKKEGRLDDDDNIITSKDKNNVSKGRYHSDWLKMMYPRLKLARNLLSEDGVIFISIDDNEQENLKKICNELFGEQNKIETFYRVTKKSSNSGDNFSPCIDLVLGYSKDIKKICEFVVPLTDEIKQRYNKEDEYVNERGKYQEVGLFQAALKHGGSSYPIKCPDGEKVVPPNSLPWRWNKETFEKGLMEGRIVFKKTNTTPLLLEGTNKRGKWNIYTKVYLNEREGKGIHPKNYSEDFQNTFATNEINKLKIPFDFAKPTSLLEFLINLMDSNNAIILDFFSGSATTAHAVMKLNVEDGGNRQFIMVQLPEATDEGSEAYKSGFKNICDIGEERIRRAGKKILEEMKEIDIKKSSIRIDDNGSASIEDNTIGVNDRSPLDIGFRVYKIDDSNMKDIYYKPSELSQENVLDLISNVKEDRSALDLLTQVMLNLGLTLDLKIEEKKIGDNLYYFVEDNALVACFDNKINLDTLKEALVDRPLKIVCKESSFEKDQDKINFNERIKKYSPETEKYII